ncbi:MAG: 3-deoxy-7-phosphoheptulonate synthase, partial [Lachnospiraceae bacterium]|nr:3-deoxy-7-phosphoheptulonate synthase [Lachnospiraceae bacterium]
MIIILKQHANPAKVEELKQELIAQGFKLHLSEGTQASLIGLIGDTSHVHDDWLRALDVVDSVRRIREPYKKANRSMHPEDTVIDICGHKIGDGHFQVIAGPCSIETKEQIIEVAEDVKNSGAHFLRGGAFKPRTSPYAFQGL